MESINQKVDILLGFIGIQGEKKEMGRILGIRSIVKELLYLSIGSCLCIEAFGGDGVNLINEYDGRRVLTSQSKHITHLTEREEER